jgi:hypothetical protein
VNRDLIAASRPPGLGWYSWRVSRRGKHPATHPQQVLQQPHVNNISYRGSSSCPVMIVSHNPP